MSILPVTALGRVFFLNGTTAMTSVFLTVYIEGFSMLDAFILGIVPAMLGLPWILRGKRKGVSNET
jgi:hypothetical protein